MKRVAYARLMDIIENEDESSRRTVTMRTRVALHPLFAGLNTRALSLLADCAIAAEFKRGQVILREGEEANRFYLIESGKVELEAKTPNGDSVVIDTIGAGDLLGWSWMFAPYRWRFTARAAEATRVIFFHGEILRQYSEQDHTLGFELSKRMSPTMIHRLQRARETLIGVHAGTVHLKPVESPFMDHDLPGPDQAD